MSAGAKAAPEWGAEELRALWCVCQMTLTPDPSEAGMGRILVQVARALDAPIVLLERLDRVHDRLVIAAAHAPDAPRLAGTGIPVHETPTAAAVQMGLPRIEADVRGRSDPAHEALRELRPRLWASFPLLAGGTVSGALTVIDREPREVDTRWVRLGTTLASILTQLLDRGETRRALLESESRHRALAEELQRANEELEAFAYSVSHDLRAPLRTMQGFAQAILQGADDTLPGDTRDYALRILAAGRESEGLVADLLAYSRLSFQKLELQPVELSTALDQALEQVRADLDERRARVDVEPRLPTVLGSHAALVQVLANLVSNAVKFVPDGRRPHVRVRAWKRGERVRLRVEDNGIGIPEGQEERIFRAFERLGGAGGHPGTGIGLAIVRRGMERIQGSCGVERLPEGGSAFWIEALGEPRQTRRPRSRRGRS